jgi:hypothetical protein
VGPDIGLRAGAADLSAAVARVNPELTAAVPPAALAGVIAVAAAFAAALLPPAAARAVRSGELVCRPPAWARDMLLAGMRGRVVATAALAAPLLTALLWFPPSTAVWGLAAAGDRLAVALPTRSRIVLLDPDSGEQRGEVAMPAWPAAPETEAYLAALTRDHRLERVSVTIPPR